MLVAAQTTLIQLDKYYRGIWFPPWLRAQMIVFKEDKTSPKFSVVPAAKSNHHDDLRRENANLRAMLAKTQEELTNAQQREQRSRYLAFHDELTALPNRRFFLERLARALGNQESGPPDLAVIYLDLDGFKALNDTFGHGIGDTVLGLIARRIAHALRAEDLVSRLGGDEYACLITGVSCRKRLHDIALKLFEAVSAPCKIGALAVNVRPSIGVALCPFDGTTGEALMQAADAAMYGAKRNRSSFAFSNRLHCVGR
ncbi:MAG: diguanylate cyclase domain-containing protein [Steroidobacteraceae bacterium]